MVPALWTSLVGRVNVKTLAKRGETSDAFFYKYSTIRTLWKSFTEGGRSLPDSKQQDSVFLFCHLNQPTNQPTNEQISPQRLSTISVCINKTVVCSSGVLLTCILHRQIHLPP